MAERAATALLTVSKERGRLGNRSVGHWGELTLMTGDPNTVFPVATLGIAIDGSASVST